MSEDTGSRGQAQTLGASSEHQAGVSGYISVQGAVLVSERRTFVGQALANGRIGGCRVIALPGLHQRRCAAAKKPVVGATAQVINFPAPRWQRNALART